MAGTLIQDFIQEILIKDVVKPVRGVQEVDVIRASAQTQRPPHAGAQVGFREQIVK